MAIVSLRDQRITVYDAAGWILKAPVSSGQKGRETPAGIFSVIQKEAEHYSNLYDDAFMPPGRALHCTADRCRDMRRPMAASECPTTSPHACST
jgi:L,D-transpeptidase catalytic domain